MQINFQITDIYYLIFGFIFGCFISMLYISKLKKEIKTIKRKYEKKSIGMDDSSLKVKTLENKIKTLETALKKQIDNKE